MEAPVLVRDESVDKNEKPRGTYINFNALESSMHENILEDKAYVNIDEDNENVKYLLNLPELNMMLNTINMQNIQNNQRANCTSIIRHHQIPHVSILHQNN